MDRCVSVNLTCTNCTDPSVSAICEQLPKPYQDALKACTPAQIAAKATTMVYDGMGSALCEQIQSALPGMRPVVGSIACCSGSKCNKPPGLMTSDNGPFKCYMGAGSQATLQGAGRLGSDQVSNRLIWHTCRRLSYFNQTCNVMLFLAVQLSSACICMQCIDFSGGICTQTVTIHVEICANH